MVAAALFCSALVVRWLSTGGPVLGDESWYLYLAHTLGREPAAEVDHAWFHVANRPLYYAIFHAGSYFGFTGFRWFGSVVSACSVAATYGVARQLGAQRWSAACAAAVLCMERPLVEYGSHGFPDPLATLFALAALSAANMQRAGTTCLCVIGCVLCKESFVAVSVIATVARLSRGPMRPDAWAWVTVLLPVAYVAIITCLGSSQGIALQGWAQTPMSWKHARGMWVGPELWPGIIWCVWQRRWQWLAVWLGMPMFYLVWSIGLGRGLAPWYVIGPASLGAVAVALTFSDIAASATPKHGIRWAIVLAACTLPIAWSGILRAGSQVLALRSMWPVVDDAADVRAQLHALQPERVLLVNCFWAFGYSHLRGAAPAKRAYWVDEYDNASVVADARAAQVTIVCRAPEHRAKEARLAEQGFRTLLQTNAYWVLGRYPEAPVR